MLPALVFLPFLFDAVQLFTVHESRDFPVGMDVMLLLGLVHTAGEKQLGNEQRGPDDQPGNAEPFVQRGQRDRDDENNTAKMMLSFRKPRMSA